MQKCADQGNAGPRRAAAAIRLIRFTSACFTAAMVSTAGADGRGLSQGLEANSPHDDQISVVGGPTQLQRQVIEAGDEAKTSISDTAPESEEDCE